jgi:hypothetical protein
MPPVLRCWTMSLQRRTIRQGGSTMAAARPALRELNLALPSNAKFDEIVAKLKLVLTLPKGINGGCDPCFSGLDKIAVINEKIING